MHTGLKDIFFFSLQVYNFDVIVFNNNEIYFEF